MRKQHWDAATSWHGPSGRADGDFIPELHARLARGDFKGRGPVTTREGHAFADAELLVRIMLADWLHFDDLPAEQRDDVRRVARRREVWEDLQDIVATLGARRDGPSGEQGAKPVQ